jgi:hypothetical protein
MQYFMNKAAATAASIQVQHGLLLQMQYLRNKVAATAASIQVQHGLLLQMQIFRNKAAATATSIQVQCIAATQAIFQEQSSHHSYQNSGTVYCSSTGNISGTKQPPQLPAFRYSVLQLHRQYFRNKAAATAASIEVNVAHAQAIFQEQSSRHGCQH